MAEPKPHATAKQYESLQWPTGTRRSLCPYSQPLPLDLTRLLEERQTSREFNGELTDEMLGGFLWLACRNRSLRPSPYGVPQESRPHPSAGGMHPIHVFIAKPDGPWHRYDPVEHALVEVPASDQSARDSRAQANMLVHLDRGTLIGLLAEPGKTSAKYENHDSLVWRDAGVILGYMSVVAAALRLSFCPLGALGEPHLSSISPDPTRVHAAGLSIVGKP